jgi:hypothetical protein
MTNIILPLELKDGLILRRGAPQDLEAVATFNSHVHNDDGFDKDPIEWIYHWTKDLMNGTHPAVKAEDFTVVMDGDKLVSTMMLIPQTWTYEGIPFQVGRIELVGTHPDYRKRSLIRMQFDVIHQWCQERNLPVQAITGIPWYYRLFGYEMALPLAAGRIGYPSDFPDLKKDEGETFQFRPATQDDIPFIQKVKSQTAEREPIQCQLPDEYLAYMLPNGHRKWGFSITIIEDLKHKAVGFLSHAIDSWGPSFHVFSFELEKSASWIQTFPAVLRWSRMQGIKYAIEDEKNEKDEIERTFFNLGMDHPCYSLLPDHLPRVRDPYGWYMRVPDLRSFLEHVQPALETRLAASNARGYTGEFSLNFYKSGIKMHFENGKIEKIEDWQPNAAEGSARFPDLTFLQMVFAFRSFELLDQAYPDCYAGGNAAAVLNALFPRHSSNVQPVQ